MPSINVTFVESVTHQRIFENALPFWLMLNFVESMFRVYGKAQEFAMGRRLIVGIVETSILKVLLCTLHNPDNVCVT